jgi:hypothetical protein
VIPGGCRNYINCSDLVNVVLSINSNDEEGLRNGTGCLGEVVDDGTCIWKYDEVLRNMCVYGFFLTSFLICIIFVMVCMYIYLVRCQFEYMSS